jgi:predicted oxidoreductase
MATLKEIADEVRKLPKDQEYTDKKITLSFEGMELYCAVKKHSQKDIQDCCYLAVVLSVLVKKGLGGQTNDFLQKFSDKLPDRVKTLLGSSILRMESF